VELETLLGLGFQDPNGQNGVGGNPAFAILGHSSSLVSRFVSAINPRAILFTPLPPAGTTPSGYVIVAFSRGDSFAEVIAHDATTNALVLYLVRFQNRCTGADGGCIPADRLLPGTEKDWQSMTSYESTALGDTILDCHQCHQPVYNNGYGPLILRMQEATPPYTHFFSSSTLGGKALLADFHAAHGTTEDYAGIPASMIDKSDPQLLDQLIARAGFSQPNAFDSAAIEAEVQASAPSQPGVNWPMGASATWSSIYAQARVGDQIAVPYHDVKVTDPDKLGAASALYRTVQSGQAPPGALTDIRDVLLAPGARDMGFAPAAGSSGADLFVQICQQCHNSRLNTQLSRGNFNVELLVSGQLRPAENQVAVGRLSITDPTDPLMMPPPLLRTLTPSERQSMITFLEK
jgi:mono/diheme cytochrome c family protein